jgi:hypothetical protein
MKCLLTGFFVLAAASFVRADKTTVTSIPWSQLGAEVQKRADGHGSHVTFTTGGAKLKADMQDIEGEATSAGLWLISTAEEDAGKSSRFRILATGMTRHDSSGWAIRLPSSGEVRTARDGAALIRPGLVEEYSVSTDGLRQDFVITQRPVGVDSLKVNLEVTGAEAESSAYGAKLTLHGSQREIAYSRLRVTDANGKELRATMDAISPNQLVVSVKDAEAVYPIRIDPTFSDADWVSLTHGVAGASGPVYALAFDDSGNLYVGGSFGMVGNLTTNNIAKWNGSAWSALGNGIGGYSEEVRALAVVGGNLYAGGSFQFPSPNIARWNGITWASVGTGLNGPVNAFAYGADTLFIGGQFTNGIARLIPGYSFPFTVGSGVNKTVSALAFSGTSLYIGGDFTTAGGSPASCVAMWDTSSEGWTAMGSGIGGTTYDAPVVKALAVIGTSVYAGGRFSTAGGVAAANLAKWDGSTWSPLGGGISTDPWWEKVSAMAVVGSDLFVGGSFYSLGGLNISNLAKWNGASWSAVGNAPNGSSVGALAVRGADLYAASDRTVPPEQNGSNAIMKWDSTMWSSVGPGMDGWVFEVQIIDGDLYVGGGFSFVNGVAAKSIVKWNGSVWSPIGLGVAGMVRVIEKSGNDIYVGGFFSRAGNNPALNIAKWDGTAWSALGHGVGPGSFFIPFQTGVSAITFSSGDVYAGGYLTESGGTPLNNVARWDGSSWSALGAGRNEPVTALAMHGGHLYAGGNGLARWDGANWVTIASGTFNSFLTNDNDLYAGGAFTSIGGIAAAGVAKWNGSTWSSLGNSGVGTVLTMALSGGNLYVGGDSFGSNLARWNGIAWSSLGSGTTFGYGIKSIAANSTHLFAGGGFLYAGGKLSPYLAQANIPATTAFQDWRQAHFGSMSNTGAAANAFDADNDGLPNLLEWACSLHPTQNDTLRTLKTLNGSSVEFTYPRSVEAVNAGTVFTVEWSDSLPGTAWSTAGVTQAVLSDNGTTQQVKATLPAGTNGKRFVRLKVTAAE